jgi:hypothetical protein
VVCIAAVLAIMDTLAALDMDYLMFSILACCGSIHQGLIQFLHGVD